MTDRELMQQALDALCDIIPANANKEEIDRIQHTAIIALRERLAQPEQEPVAWFDKELNTFKWRDGLRNCDLADQQPLHIAPQPTHQESVRDLLISAASMAVVAERQGKYEGASWVADAVLERAQPEQEPVAHTLNCVCGAVWDVSPDGVEEMVHAPNPTQRKPLTHPQIHELDWPDGVSFEEILPFARSIEAAHGIGEKAEREKVAAQAIRARGNT